MTKPFSTTHSPASLKKMSTEAMHRIYTHYTGNTLFNPYQERSFMSLVIIGHESKLTLAECGKIAANGRARYAATSAQWEQVEAGRKYTDSQVATIRAAREDGMSFRNLANMVGGSVKAVEKIAKGITYTTKSGSFPKHLQIIGMYQFVAKEPTAASTQDSTSEWLTSLGF